MPDTVVRGKAVTVSLLLHLPLVAWLCVRFAPREAVVTAPPIYPVAMLPSAHLVRPTNSARPAFRRDEVRLRTGAQAQHEGVDDHNSAFDRVRVDGLQNGATVPGAAASQTTASRLAPARSVYAPRYTAVPARGAGSTLPNYQKAAAGGEETGVAAPVASSNLAFANVPVSVGSPLTEATTSDAHERNTGGGQEAASTSVAAPPSGPTEGAPKTEAAPRTDADAVPAPPAEQPRPPAPVRAAERPAQPVPSGDDDDESGAEPVFQPYPDIPDSLLDDVSKRTVLVRFDIGEDGKATASVVGSSGSREVDDIVRRACGRWRFTPAKSKGRPVASTRRLRVEIR